MEIHTLQMEGKGGKETLEKKSPDLNNQLREYVGNEHKD